MNKIDHEQLIFFEFLSTLSQEQLVKYFAMLAEEEQDYVRSVVQNIGTQLNMELPNTLMRLRLQLRNIPLMNLLFRVNQINFGNTNG
jgi:hypothetical protein